MPVRGLDRTLANLSALGARQHSATDEFLLREAQAVLDESLQLVPHDTGDLARSGEVKRSGGRVGVGVERGLLGRSALGQFTGEGYTVAYGKDGDASAYAHVVHETPSKHDPPTWQGKRVQFNTGSSKYLERPFRQRIGTVFTRLAAHLRGRLR